MELNEQEKEKIVAEEKLRMETRKEFFKENFGGGGMWRGRWGGYGHGCHGMRCGGGGFLKGILLALLVIGLFHLWHRPCYNYGAPGYYGCPAPPMAPQAVPQTPAKN